MEFLNKFTDYFLSSEKRFSSKFILFSLVVSNVLFADYFFGFSQSYIINTKIKQIEQIESLLQKDTMRIEARNELIRMEKSVIQRQGFWELVSFSSFTSLIQRTINSPNNNDTSKIDTKPVIKQRNVWYHNISSGWVFWLFVLVSPVIWLTQPKNKDIFFGIILMDLFFAGLAFGFAYAFAFIPVLWSPVVNYTLNAMLCISIVVVVSKVGTKKE